MGSKKKWTVIATVTMALILAVVLTVDAGRRGGGKGGGGGFDRQERGGSDLHKGGGRGGSGPKGGERGSQRKGMKSRRGGLERILDPSDDQKVELGKIRSEARKEMEGLDRDGLSRDELREKMSGIRARMMERIEEELTSEQAAKLEERQAARREASAERVKERSGNSDE